MRSFFSITTFLIGYYQAQTNNTITDMELIPK